MKPSLLKRLEALEAIQSRSRYQLTPGQNAAFDALHSYGKKHITWDLFCIDFPHISEIDKRLAYDAEWLIKHDHPELWADLDGAMDTNLERPPWAVSQLATKVINDD